MSLSKLKLLKDLFSQHESVKPWRDYTDLQNGWDREYYKELLTRIKKTTTFLLGNDDVHCKTVNFLMLGGSVLSGKTSTIYSILFILHGRPKRYASSFLTFAKAYSYICIEELDDIVLFDTSYCISNEDIIMCMNGGPEEAYQFYPSSSEQKGITSSDREIHCVVYCVNARSLFPEIVEPLRRRLQEIESTLELFAQDRIVLVTNVDSICDETRKDIRRIFHSNNIKNVVERAATVFKVSLSQVHPIKNYTDEQEIDEYTNIPILLALSKAVDIGTDYLRNKAVFKSRRMQQFNTSNVLDHITYLEQEQQTEIFADLLFYNPSIL